MTGRNDAPETIDLDGAVISVNSTIKTVGTWIAHDLSSTKSIAENIAKARTDYFALGMSRAYTGSIISLSSKSIIDTCV